MLWACGLASGRILVSYWTVITGFNPNVSQYIGWLLFSYWTVITGFNPQCIPVYRMVVSFILDSNYRVQPPMYPSI